MKWGLENGDANERVAESARPTRHDILVLKILFPFFAKMWVSDFHCFVHSFSSWVAMHLVCFFSG